MNVRWACASLFGLATLTGCSGVTEDDLAAVPATIEVTTPTTEVTTPTTTQAPSTAEAPATTEAPSTTEAPTTTGLVDDEPLEELPMTGADEAMLFIAVGCALLVGGRSLIDAVNAVSRRVLPALAPERPAPPR